MNVDGGHAFDAATAQAVVLEAPLEDAEVVVLGAALIAFGYALHTLRGPDRPAGSGLCLGALACLCLGLLATNFEHVARGDAATGLNVVEHLAYVAHTALVSAYVLARRRGGAR